MKQILVVMPVTEAYKKILEEAAGDDAVFCYIPDHEVTREDVEKADIIIGNVKPADLAGCSHLEWIQLNSAGYDNYLGEGILPKNTILTNATGAYGPAISEHMVGSVLYLMKRFGEYAANQRENVWRDQGKVHSVFESRTLVVGAGDIGSQFAMRMHALGSQVSGIRRNISVVPEYMEALYPMSELKRVIGDADVVASCLPDSPQTRGIFNKETFAAMKEGAYFVNVGRGGAVNQMDLYEALTSGHLAGAAIDVTTPEPLPEDHPLWTLKNCQITPHVAGGYHLEDVRARIIQIASSNLRAMREGKALRNVIAR